MFKFPTFELSVIAKLLRLKWENVNLLIETMLPYFCIGMNKDCVAVVTWSARKFLAQSIHSPRETMFGSQHRNLKGEGVVFKLKPTLQKMSLHAYNQFKCHLNSLHRSNKFPKAQLSEELSRPQAHPFTWPLKCTFKWIRNTSELVALFSTLYNI